MLIEFSIFVFDNFMDYFIGHTFDAGNPYLRYFGEKHLFVNTKDISTNLINFNMACWYDLYARLIFATLHAPNILN